MEKYGIGAAKNDTFVKQVRYEISTDKSNKSIHLELSMPTCARNYKASFRENKLKTLVFNDWIRTFWACFHENVGL